MKYTDEYKLEQASILKRLSTQIEEENERVKITQIHIEIDSRVYLLNVFESAPRWRGGTSEYSDACSDKRIPHWVVRVVI